MHRRLAVLYLAVATLLVGLLPGTLIAQDANGQRAVLVTGATSGIGRATAELLAENGFFVYAGARKDSDMAELNAIPNMMAVRLDVTIQEQIDAAVETIRAEGRGLWGLINNAGVAVLDPLVEVDEEDMFFQLDVNVMGPYRVTKAFAPLIIESQGRVSTTGSLSGFVTWNFGGPYTMSKHAVEAFSEVLALEMDPFGVDVSVVEPGNFDSRIYENLIARREARGVTSEGSLYGNTIDGMLERATTARQAPQPTAVAEAFLHAMSSDDPKAHYLVVPVEGEARFTIQSIFNRLAEVNRDHEYSYTREQLIQMLDAALEGAGN